MCIDIGMYLYLGDAEQAGRDARLGAFLEDKMTEEAKKASRELFLLTFV